jgi:hypothetical protein
MTARPPIAFIGPSIPRDEAARLCPSLDIRPPIRRGDLYREREHGAWGFLIIDGVFMADQAVSPREVVDVLADGALVVGASSMGALRAADCWPAGAIGVGIIYRLYRLGILDSDEEVAVAVHCDGTDLAASIPLVNVRYAVARAVRRRILDRETGCAVLEAASSIYYPERTWREVLRRAGVKCPEVHKFCIALDLKRSDAQRAIARMRTLLLDRDRLALRHCRTGEAPFDRSEDTREREHDVYGGVDRKHLQLLLLDWLVGSGRIVRYRVPVSAPLRRMTDQSGAYMTAFGHDLPLGSSREAHAIGAWQSLVRAGELDAELMRMKAIGAAQAEAKRLGLAPRSRDVRIARREIANNYGFMSWESLLDSESGRRFADVISCAGEKLALAKRMRDAWFNPEGVQSTVSASSSPGDPSGMAAVVRSAGSTDTSELHRW